MTVCTYNGPSSIPDNLKDASIAIGNFDGLHKGHQAVLESAIDFAKSNQCAAILVTFEPHPKSVFQKDLNLFRLTPPDQKAQIALALGMDAVINIPFNLDFASLSADRFIEEILIKALRCKCISIGYDFHFGHKRQGTPELLQQNPMLEECLVNIVPAQTLIVPAQTLSLNPDDSIVSSSVIRSAIRTADFSQTKDLLGYHWYFSQKIIEGQQLGRRLGFPTANMRLDDNIDLPFGIYAVRIKVNESLYTGVASYGQRPSIDNGDALFETYIFDFDQQIYNQDITIIPVAFLREEIQFPNIDLLVAQMKKDSQEAKTILKNQPSATPIDVKLGHAF